MAYIPVIWIKAEGFSIVTYSTLAEAKEAVNNYELNPDIIVTYDEID